MTRIASLTNWANQYENTKYASQTSANVTLQAGQLYYFELRHVEAGGGDGWNIFWKTPTNATWQIIQSQNLARPCFNNVFAAQSSNVFTFAAKAEVNQAKLQWISNGGLKNDYFEVERANEAGTFETIGTVNAATGKVESESFNFTDVSPLEGDNSYRIKTVENAGTIKLSDIQTVTFSKNTEGVRLFPNPANDYVDLDLKKFDGSQVTITVYNQFGKLLQTAQIEKASTAPFRLELGDVATGSYTVRVQAQGKKEVVQKLQIVK
jgi:Secretion system C-terminal sorting domain